MPDLKQEIRNRLEGLSLSPARENEIVEELEQHLADRQNELRALGHSEEDAVRSALAELDGHELLQQLRRVERAEADAPALGANPRKNFFASAWQDLRYAFRILKLNPSFTAVAIISLALGIGANSAIFQLLDAVRLRALPVQDPQNLAIVQIDFHHWGSGSFHGDHPDFTYPLWEQIKANQQGFSSIFTWGTMELNLSQGGEMHLAHSILVSGSYFQTLGVAPMLGRVLNEADDVKGCGASSVVLSYAFWEREFGGDPAAVGRKLMLESQPFEVVGITPPSFFGVDVGKNFDVAVPICSEPLFAGEMSALNRRSTWWIAIMGRLKPGWTVEKASTQLGAIGPAVLQATVPPEYHPDQVKHYMDYRLRAKPGGSGYSGLREEYENPLWLLLGIAGLVLLIACANLANLMLARAKVREREIAVRLALGADRKRLVRQLLTESLLLAFVGAACGTVMAAFVSRFLVTFLDTQRDPVFMSIGFDWRILAFTTGLAVLTCILFGLTPALNATRVAPHVAMAAGGRTTSGKHERFGIRRVLVVTQIALSLVLVITALLFVRSLTKLMNLDAGFRRDGILIAALDLTHLNIPAAQRVEFKRQVVERINAIPQVQSAAATSIVPANNSFWNEVIVVDEKNSGVSNFSRVSPEYFTTMGTTLLAGRNFNQNDTATSQPVAVVNEAFVKKMFGGGNGIGRRFRLEGEQGKTPPLVEVVGIVRNTKYADLRRDYEPIAFVPAAQDAEPDLDLRLVIHSEASPGPLVEQVKSALHDINPTIAVQFRTFSSQIRDQLLRERLLATLSGLFGFLAGVLAVVGIYGVISYMVVRRTNEIGVRMALGANPRDIVRLVLGEAGALLGLGLVIGTVLALIATRTAASLLYGLKPSDVATYLLAITSLTCVAVAASFIPAQRASRLDPMVALREE